MDLDDASSSETETEQPPYSRNHPPHQSNSSNDEDDRGLSNSSADEEHPRHHVHHAQPHRVHSSHRLSRHHTKPIGSRTTSYGKNLHKLATQSHLHDAAPAPAAPSTQSSRPAYRRAVSSSLTSPTSTSPRPSQAFRRNASAFAMSRGTTHSALKKNHSSGHLPRHPGKVSAKTGAGRPGAHPMKRTSSGKGQKSPKEPQDSQHPTVRFDLGSDVAPPGEGDEDNEWTEDSTSVSPNTTRDHTRQNSVVLEGNMNALRIGLSSGVAPAESSPLVISSQAQESSGSGSETHSRNASTTIQRSSSTHNIPTADAVTSRILMRGPAQNPTGSTVASSVTADNAATPQTNYSNSDGYAVPDHNSGGSGVGSAGSNVVGRFINGNSSQGTPSDLQGETFVDSRTIQIPTDSPSIGKGKERAMVSKSLDSHRRNKSLSNVATAKSATRTHAPPSNLPPSRTQQKLELMRVSSVLESTKQVIPVLPRPSAPLILRSGLNVGFGFSEGDHFTTQTHSLYTQIDKEYTVVRRYRQPVADSLTRLDPHTKSSVKRKGKARSHVEPPRTDAEHTHRSRHRPMDDNDSSHSPSHVPDFHYPKPVSARNAAARQQQHDMDGVDSSPEKVGKSRKSRVSFEIPPKSIATSEDADADEEEEGDRKHGRVRTEAENEVLEICRRMWDLNGIAAGTMG